MESLIEKEKLAQNYLDEGNKDAAIKLLFELVAVCARGKNFEAAEAMRSRIFEIDAMALDEIIRSGEIIEEAKKQAIDSGHRQAWAALYDTLSVEEANTFYFALTTTVYQAGEEIFRQGDWKPRLYLVNSGRAKIVYLQGDREVFLKNIEKGEFVGEDTFFSFAICTTTMIAQSRTEISYLDSGVLKAWRTTSPVLESKLQSFTSRAEKITDLLDAKRMDRRVLRRINPGGKAAALLVDSSGKPVGKPFKVELYDISQGGICFMVRITKRETAGLLLGKRVCISYLHPQLDTSHSIKQSGTIVGVHFHPFEDCSVNVKFDTLLPESLIEQLEKLPPPSHNLDL